MWWGREVLGGSVGAYRKIRNTLRYLVANLYDFDPAVDRLPLDRLEEIDRYVLGRYGALGQRIVKAYAEYDYATVFQGLNAFATVDLSAFYADVSKDRLYTFAARSPQRRSAQTAICVMAEGLVRLMAPILPFTADELWRFVPGPREESVHIALFPSDAELSALADGELLERWTKLLATREEVLAHIEPLRKSKQIGSSLQAKGGLSATPEELALLQHYAKDLPMLFIVSEVELRPAPANVDAWPRVTIERAGGVKCERCWRYVNKVSSDPAWAGLCERCQDALSPGDQAA